MKLRTHTAFILILMACLLTLTSSPLMAQVYKVVDEDGNVTFTDQAPYGGAKPIELKPISVVEAPIYETPPKRTAEGAEGDEENQMSIRELRRAYSDFAIVSPQSEQSIYHPESAVAVIWRTAKQLQTGMQVTVSINGKPLATTTEPLIEAPELDRGEHTVTAVLTDRRNRNIATAEPVTFFVQRPNIYTNRARPTPRGGG